MSTQHTPELFASAAAFYENQPTGQYDNEAAHALRCHHDLLEALTPFAVYGRSGSRDVEVGVAIAAIAKAKGGAR